MSYEYFEEARRDRESCELFEREAALDHAMDVAYADCMQSAEVALTSKDFEKAHAIAGDVRIAGGKTVSFESRQSVVDMLIEHGLSGDALVLLSDLIASPAGAAYRQAVAKRHAEANYVLLAQAEVM